MIQLTRFKLTPPPPPPDIKIGKYGVFLLKICTFVTFVPELHLIDSMDLKLNFCELRQKL